MTDKRLLVVAHAPSPNTEALRRAVAEGAAEADEVETLVLGCFETQPEHVLGCHAVILGTTENLGYMSGALKDFFDRCYYAVIDHTEALPYALYVRAGQDGTGTRRAVESIATGLRWKPAHAPVVCRGAWDDAFLEQVRELGTFMAVGLEAGVL